MKINSIVLGRVYIRLLSKPTASKPTVYYEIERLAIKFISKYRNKKCLKGKK